MKLKKENRTRTIRMRYRLLYVCCLFARVFFSHSTYTCFIWSICVPRCVYLILIAFFFVERKNKHLNNDHLEQKTSWEFFLIGSKQSKKTTKKKHWMQWKPSAFDFWFLIFPIFKINKLYKLTNICRGVLHWFESKIIIIIIIW